jgi:hypothetical protein
MDIPFTVLWSVWAGLAVAGALLFFLYPNAGFKRKYFPWYIGSASVLFFAYIATWAPIVLLAITAPLVAAIAYFNLRMVRFCDMCGATTIGSSPFRTPTACGVCKGSIPRPQE